MYSRPVKRKKPAVLERNRREIKDWKEEVETLGEERIVILRNHPQREREIKIPLHDPKEEPYEPADTKEQPKNLLAQLKKKSEECDRVKLELLTLKHRFETLVENSDVLHFEKARLQASVEELTQANTEMGNLRKNLITLHNENTKLKASVETLNQTKLEPEYLREELKVSHCENMKVSNIELKETLHELDLARERVRTQQKNINFLSLQNENLRFEIQDLRSVLSVFIGSERNESPLTVTTNEAQADAQLVNFKWRERTFFNEFSRCVVEITCRPKKLSNCWSVRANVGISYVYRHEKFSEMKTFTFNPLMPTVRIVLNKPRMNRNNTSSVRSLVGVLEIDGFEGLQEEIPTFDFANSETFHDEVFVVEGQPFYVQSQNVFVHSPVLERIVNEKKNEMKEDKIKKEIEEEQISGIELNDVTADEFRHFLNAIHPFRDGICAKNVGAVLRLAEMYEAASLFAKCERFLRSEEGKKICVVQRLDWAARYRMNDLENDLYQSMNGLHMLAELGENPEWINLCEAAKTRIIDFFFRLEKSFAQTILRFL